MTKIKLCGITRACELEAVNLLQPEYIGFVFAKKSKRYVTPEAAQSLKAQLSEEIQAVGVFVNEPVEIVAKLLNHSTIDLAQLHGEEDETYIQKLRQLTDRPIIKAFQIGTAADLRGIEECSADYLLLDSGAGSGETFDWSLLEQFHRPFFLAGGLDAGNVKQALDKIQPFAVDVSSGIETDGVKDKKKMAAFVAAVREE